MNLRTVFFIIVIIILLYITIRYITKDANTLSGLTSGTSMTTVNASSLAQSSSGVGSSNFAYSIWFYINDWNYRYGEPKIIYGRMAPPKSASSGSVGGCAGTQYGCCPDNITAKADSTGSNCNMGGCSSTQYGCCPDSVTAKDSTGSNCGGDGYSDACPVVVLGPVSNNIDIKLTVYSDLDSVSNSTGTSSVIPHNCAVPNIPIQKWVNLIISVYGRTLDVYLDGKLIKTDVLPGIAKINNDANIYVTPNGGFAGWTSSFQYYPDSLNPQDAWNIYQKGYGSNMLSNVFGKYQVKVSVVENGTENSSVTI